MAHSLIQPGTQIAGKYRIIRILGEGGMGMVYMANHELLDRTVAIKVLHAQLEHRELAVKRFQREIKAMASVHNPYIAQAVDAGVLDSGALYLVMEYLDGHNLRAELKLRGAVPYPEAVAYVMQACAGVAAVHDVGIIHRDLKPHNLFLIELQGARRIKVLDFGIAKFIDRPDGALTDADVAVGTPLYMSPEQLARPEEISRRTDVWALAVVLYELIAGVSPFAANTPGAVVAAVVLQDPVPLSSIVPEVPHALARVVAKALSKSQAQRTTGVRELAQELAPFGLPLERVIVRTPARSSRAVPSLERVSVRPELAACIEMEVEAFESESAPRSSDAPEHVVRQLPSLAKLAIPMHGSDPLSEPFYLEETVEQPVAASAAEPRPQSRFSSQPTTLLFSGASGSEPSAAVGAGRRGRQRLVAGLAFIVLCASASATLMGWPRATESSKASTAKPVTAIERERVFAPNREVANDTLLSTSAARDSAAMSADDRAHPRPPTPAMEGHPGRATSPSQRSTAAPLPHPPTTAASSAPESKPLHL